MPDLRVWPGAPYPLGATWDGEGTNFSIFSEHATGVELCLFDESGQERRIELVERTDLIWHAYLPDVRPGQLYGYRLQGPYEPDEGHRFNPNKLVLDPYAKAVNGDIEWNDALFGYRVGDPDADLTFDERDSAPYMPKCSVIDPSFTWGDDRPPAVPFNRSLIYECHVRGMTMLHPGVPEALRGTYLGMASDPIIDHLLSLGVTAVELMPVHQFIKDRYLVDKGLTNYWGYNSIAFLAPENRYAASDRPGSHVSEFKSMVKAFHRAGIEVILDVVYNHTGEGNHMGPTIGLRGVDNQAYYRLNPGDERYYFDFTGTGNSLNMRHPRTVQLIFDSLRYWVGDMHVDGFRFDLAPVLARELYEVDRLGAFFDIMQQDPVLSQVKLIAEPWDLGEGGYQIGNFPVGWAEWNGEFRDGVRAFWRADPGKSGELASRISGSSDLYAAGGRRTYASVNFVTAHDGFTLNDLVSYEQKHNEANGEDNRDGADDNLSRNWGVEGPTDNPAVVAMRQRMKKNFLATLVFSQGVRMLLGGDEMGRTQGGNNNAYCQDNEISWVHWDLDAEGRELLGFTREILRIFRDNPVFRRRGFFTGRPVRGEIKDVTWLHPSGREMTDGDWADGMLRSVGMLIDGEATDEVDERGRPVRGRTVLLMLNGGENSRRFVIPQIGLPGVWVELMNTSRTGTRPIRRRAVNVIAHSMILAELTRDPRPAS
ncbi:MAG TPA: glycogen debranching protein GlgX [Gaiellales bacterium]|nr:glycogen debranching protein GlgX [Gaiellales bacterium]